MRHSVVVSVCVSSMLTLAACSGGNSDAAVERKLKNVNVIDESNLNDVMLNAGDPREAVAYFQRASAEKPERIDLKRGLAMSLVRAKQVSQGVGAWKEVVGMEGATPDDSVELADALIRNDAWPEAEQVLGTIPPTHETFKRYRLEAMIADS
ncbi:MAG: hypothetical protein ABI459_11560, partial [Deltaproteobacteria bacterium]